MISTILINPQVFYEDEIAVSFSQTCIVEDDKNEIARFDLSFPIEITDEEVGKFVYQKAQTFVKKLEITDEIEQNISRWDWITE